jgi:hypothetical protein
LYEDWIGEGVDLPSEMYEFRGLGRFVADCHLAKPQLQQQHEQEQKHSSMAGSSGLSSGIGDSRHPMSLAADNLTFKFVNLQSSEEHQRMVNIAHK